MDQTRVDPGHPVRIGGYEILGRLGQGGMGVVYRARHATLGREVALKVLTSGHAGNEQRVQRFLREGRVLSRLRHENLVRVHELGFEDGRYFLAMDLVEGPTLQEFLEDAEPIAIDRALEIATGIARAIEHAHGHGVVHRDLKPGNVILTADGRVRVVDFGLALVLGSDLTTLTRAGAAIGTPFYMSPEQCRGRHDEIDHRTDIFSLGILLYELLTGQRPFTGSTREELHAAILNSEPRRPSLLRDGIPAGVEAICRRALAKDPDERYASASELLADLEGRPAARPNPTARRPRAALWLAGAVLLVGLVVAWAAWPAPEAPPPVATAPEPPPARSPGPIDAPVEPAPGLDEVRAADHGLRLLTEAWTGIARGTSPRTGAIEALRTLGGPGGEGFGPVVLLEATGRFLADRDERRWLESLSAVAPWPPSTALEELTEQAYALAASQISALAASDRIDSLRAATGPAAGAALLEAGGRFEEAATLLDRVLDDGSLAPGLRALALFRRARCSVAAGRPADALADFLAAWEAEPRTALWDAFFQGINDAALTGLLGTDPARGERILAWAIEANRSNRRHNRTFSRLYRATMLERLDRADEAAAEYDRALVEDPGYAYAHLWRARFRLGRGDAAGAVADFEEVEAVASQLPEAERASARRGLEEARRSSR